MRWRSAGSMPRRALPEQGVQGLRSATFEFRVPALTHPRRRRRAQREFGQRSPQVQAGAADHDRRRAVGQQLVDLRVRQRGVLGDAEACVDRQEGDEPVFELTLLSRRRGAGQELQPGVDLERVG
jgi:hypothetical protein